MTENNECVIALLGQPNSGKSTLFNGLTGMHQHVGNWPGKTVEKKEVLLRSKKELQRQDAGRVVSSAGYTMLSFEESELNG